ncbi:hypothetical protein AN639_03725 [Candidatus Epulonipiscium fishelsonii]|uniref:Uncharacterized protein n=1 Tax=Candidatus Epulonipiscium fishelsonii TaxID=77094 RepID=A0ACC8X6M5_9FIRM|nr:hypothetical protein AN396_12800 [Epulopiscium sp. SCG-B11WGA-EpuloA1]ONI41471.1 hypothetical protein AN639_03725 [Epulopiscium sp. SCG-B05WGA-EpuloA1]
MIYVLVNYFNLNVNKITLEKLQSQINSLSQIQISLDKYRGYEAKINTLESNITYIKNQPSANEINIIKYANEKNMLLEYILIKPEQIILQGKYIAKNDITDFISQIEKMYFEYDIFMDITKEDFEIQIIKKETNSNTTY